MFWKFLHSKKCHETIRILNCALSLVSSQFDQRFRRFIKARATGKLTGCEWELAINLPGCFRLLFLLSFISKTKNAPLKNSTDLLHKNLMKPLKVASIESSYDRNQRSVQSKQRLFRSKSKWCLKLQFCKLVNIIKVLVLCLTLLNENKNLRLNA